MHDLGNGRLQAEIAAVAIDAGVIGEAFGVAAEAEGIVGLIEIAGAQDEFGLVVALESGAGHDVEDAVRAVAELGAIAAAIDFDVIHVFGIELRAEILRDGGIDDRNAIQQPCGLVAAAHVEHVVRDVGAGDVVGDHGHAVGAVGAGSALDVEAADEGGGSGAVGGDDCGRAGDGDFFIRRGHLQLKVNDRHSPEMTVTSCAVCAKPLLATLTEYSPSGTALSWNSPLASVVTLFAHSDDFALSITMAS